MVRPIAIAAAVVAYVVLVGWLMLHGQLDAAAWLILAGVVGLLVLGVLAWRRHQRVWSAVQVAAALVVVAATGWYGYSLNRQIDEIPRVDDSVLDTNRDQRPPKEPAGEGPGALNILLMGADNPEQLVEKPTVKELLDDGTWDPGAYRSDTMMVVHIPANRKAAYVVSVPRDSYVPIVDAEGRRHGQNKVNESFAAYGPFGTWRTIERLSGVHLDHMAIIDYAGFRELTQAIGGVDVYIPETVYDSQQDQEWTQGWHHVEGDLALKYVRMRHGLLNGDFDRIDRQQNFLRAILARVLADETVGNPATFTKTVGAITDHLTVDSSWSTAEIRGLALGLRGLDADKVRYVTLPLAAFDDIDGVGSVNIIDEAAAKELWQAVLDDRLARYLKQHPEDELPDPKDVS